jgi:RNA polymerase sigma-70 factor (ECF subfamily)
MPPFTGWYVGAEAIGTLISTQCPASGPGDMRMVPTRANGSPAFGLYMREADGRHHAFQLQVPTLTERGVSYVAAFFDVDLFDRFGLPRLLPLDPQGEAGESHVGEDLTAAPSVGHGHGRPTAREVA